MSVDPYAVLIDIERKCREFAKALPRQKIVGKMWQGVGFTAGDYSFVTPLKEVTEVLPLPTVTMLPAGTDWFKGVANLRGRLLSISDLQGFVTDVPTKITTLSRVLIIDMEQTEIGFLVDQVLGVQRFYETALKTEIEENIDPKFIPFLQGQFTQNEKVWYVLSLKTLSQATQFYHIVKEMGV